jgi:hypothetical protein
MLWQTQGNIGAFLKKRNKTAVPTDDPALFQKPKERQSELQASSHHRIGTVRYRSVCTAAATQISNLKSLFSSLLSSSPFYVLQYLYVVAVAC